MDLLITKQHTTLDINIYRKPTATDTTINYQSNHPLEHKMAAYRFLINRMNSLPLSNNNKKKEWNIIKTIAENNKFPLHQTNKLYSNLIKQPKNNKIDKENKKWAIFTYHSPAIRIITNIFKHTNINIAYCTANTMAQQIKMNKQIQDKDHNKSGIYKLTCGTCNKAYIGQTSRNIAIRYKEHIRYIRNNQPVSICRTYTEKQTRLWKI